MDRCGAVCFGIGPFNNGEDTQAAIAAVAEAAEFAK
jgi:hypothetical protein